MATKNKDSIFDEIQDYPEDPILAILEVYNQCINTDKVNLTVGAYRDDNLKPIVFESVKIAEKELFERGFSREYLPFTGDEEFNYQTQISIFDPEIPFIRENDKLNVIENKRISSIQSISGSGSLRLGGEFLSKFIGKKIYISDLSWPNHFPIFQLSGLVTELYPYYNYETKGLNFEEMKKSLKNMDEDSIVLLHVCGHNPTGVDPEYEQWIEILKIMQERNLFPFFDLAYQGYISGDLYKDIFPIYEFLKNDFEMFIAQSFSKSMNLYGERAGALHVIVNDPNTIPNIKAHFAEIAKSIYLVPIGHGSRIIKTVIGTKSLRKIWEEELKNASDRLNRMRKGLYDELKKLSPQRDWEYIIKQKGMFHYSGLNEKQSTALIEKHNIFLVKSGRISLSGINDKNLNYVAKSILDVLENY
jgi:aspartate/tyrosine/aromatic aminotransferase